MTNSHPLAALIAGVKVKDFEVEIVRGNVGGNLALYFNDYRVAGSKPWGGGTTIHKFRVQGDDVKSSGILATIRDFQNVPVVKECLTTDAALEAAPVPDLGEAGKVLEQTVNTAIDLSDQNMDVEAKAVGKAADTIRALIALAAAQAAQIAGLEATIRKFQTVADDWECPLGVKGCAENCGNYGCGN